MNKRITAFVMALALFIGCIPMNVSAAKVEEKELSVYWNGTGLCVPVLQKSDGKILAPLSWIKNFGLMKCKEKKEEYEYYYPDQLRNDNFAKRIFIDKKDNKFSVCMYYSDSLFFDELAQNLTWLNDILGNQVSDGWKEQIIIKYFGSVENAEQLSRKYIRDKYIPIYEGKFSEKLEYQDDIWVPMEEVLPFLNAKIGVSEEGELLIQPGKITLLQALYHSHIGNVVFDADRDIVGKEVIHTGGIIIDSVIDISHIRLDRLDFIFDSGRVADYEALFKEYLLDDEVFLSAYDKKKTPGDKLTEYLYENKGVSDAMKEYKKTYELFNGTLGEAAKIYEIPNAKQYLDPLGLINSDTGKVYGQEELEIVGKLYDYVYTYTNQVDDHREMLGAVYDYTFDHAENGKEMVKIAKWPSYRAAQNVQGIYGDNVADQMIAVTQTGIREAVVEALQEETMKKVGVTPWSWAFSLTKVIMEKSDLYAPIEKGAIIDLVDNSADISYKTYIRRINEMKFDEESLNGLRLSAIMSLVTSRYAYKTYWEGEGHKEDIEKIEEMLTMFYLAADGVGCDSSDYYKKEKKRLKEEISDLQFVKVKAEKDADSDFKFSQKLTMDLNTLFDMTPEQMQCLEWDYFNITDMGYEQNVDANVGNFIFSAKCFETLDGRKFAYPHVIMAMDRYAGAGNITVIDTLVTGMTYAEVKEQIPVITELTSENMGRYYATTGVAEAVYYWDLDATIYCIFDGTGEDAVLIGVEVDRMNNYNQ